MKESEGIKVLLSEVHKLTTNAMNIKSPFSYIFLFKLIAIFAMSTINSLSFLYFLSVYCVEYFI